MGDEMKKVLGLLLLLTSSAFALLDVDRQEIFFRNFLTNPGFEYGIQGAVATNATANIESVNYATGKRALRFLATAQNGYVNLRDTTINVDVSRLQYSFYYKSAADSTVKVELRNAGTDALVATSNLLPQSSTYFKKETVTFTATPGTTYYLRLVDTSVSSWVPFYMDDAYIGEEVSNAAANVPQLEVGMLQPFLSAACPSGWIAADGSAVSRTTYGSLFAAISTTYGVGDGSTTFTLPDFRGMFLRGSGTNGTYSTYAGGAIGAYSADENKSHTHNNTVGVGSLGTSSSGDHTHNAFYPPISGADGLGGDLFYSTGLITNSPTATSAAGDHTHTITGSPSISNAASGGTETKPASYSVLYCVKH